MGNKTSDRPVMNKAGWRSRSGSAFVLLAMLFVSLVFVAVVIIDGSGTNAALQTSEASYHLAGRSILSMYDRQLEDRYGLLGVQNDTQKLKGWLQEYGNTTVSSNTLVRADSRLVSFDTDGYSLENPRILIAQIRELGKAGFVTSNMMTLLGMVRDLGSMTDTIRNLEANTKNLERDMDRAEEKAAENEDEDSDIDFGEIRRIHSELKRKRELYEQKDENPEEGTADHVLRNREIIDDLPSTVNGVGKRSFFSIFGNMKAVLIGNAGFSYGDSVWVTQYAFDHFRHHQTGIDEYDESFFDNEIEYIIYGNYSDNENYKCAYTSIRTIRFASNMSFITTNSGMVSKTKAMAEALTPGPWSGLTQLIISCAWAAYETHNDMRNIEEGYSVPIIKDEDTWMTDLDSLVNDTDGEHDFIICEENGFMTYSKYLAVIMTMENTENRLYRIMDLIQINMKGTVREDFLIEDHIGGFSMKVQVNKEYIFPVLAEIVKPAVFSQVHMYLPLDKSK